MSAGFAAADVAVSGDARMGVVSTDGVSTFSSRVHVTFSGTGTTDGGLAFGGKFDAHNASKADGGTSGSAFISGAFGKISMGGVASGDSSAVGQLASVGYEGLGSMNSISYAADGGALGVGDDNAASAKVLYTYSGNGLTLAASSAQLTNGGSTAYGVGVSYTTGGLTMALGTGQADFTIVNAATTVLSVDAEDALVVTRTEKLNATGSITDTSASVTYVMGTTTIKAIYQDKSASLTGAIDAVDVTGSFTATSMGMSVSHTIDAITLTAYSLNTEMDLADLTGEKPTLTRYGIGASYNLGGGATLAAGWAMYDVGKYVGPTSVTVDSGSPTDTNATYTTSSKNAFDVGVNFSF